MIKPSEVVALFGGRVGLVLLTNTGKKMGKRGKQHLKKKKGKQIRYVTCV